MRRRILYNSKNENTLPDGSKAKVLDVVFANKNTGKLTIVEGDMWWFVDAYPSSEWEPIGIVVIPGEHGVLKDKNGKNQCGVMSIVPMNCNTPQTGGSSEQTMYWGDTNSKINEIKYNGIVVTSNNNSNVANGISDIDAYIPIQHSSGGGVNRAYPPYAPSPYNGSDYKSGVYNESYGTTKFDTSSKKNVLADFDGQNNTKRIIAYRGSRDYNTWTPGNLSELTYPAASCCDMFCPTGTKQGDWYLPAMGELGYICPRLGDINNTIYNLNQKYRVGVKIELSDGDKYWSSTEYNGGYGAYFAYIKDGFIGNNDKDLNIAYVRAFMRL